MKNIVITLSLVILAASAVMGQTNNPQPTLVGDHPAVKAAVEKFFAEQATAATSAKSTSARFATSGPVFGGSYQLQAPPVALRLNRLQYDERDALQASLVILPSAPAVSDTPVGLSVLWVHLDSNYARGTYAGRHILLAGETIPLQTYIFDGSEPSGVYALIVLVIDTVRGQLLAMPGTHFAFRGFWRTDTRGYPRVDNAEINDRYVVMRGNFSAEASPREFVLIGNQKFPIVKSNSTTAVVDLGNAYALPAGVHDITLVVHSPGNTAYDSPTAPAVLKVFLPVLTPTAPMPPLPGPPPGKG